jgi:hypothetical protein
LPGAGGRPRAEEIINALTQIFARKPYAPPISFALLYHGLGNTDRCFDCLEKGIEEFNFMNLVAFNPFYDSLHLRPRYHALLRKMNLEPQEHIPSQ